MVGIVGARGHVGSELIRLIAAHPRFELPFVSSREREGQRLADHEAGDHDGLRYQNLARDEVARQGADAIVLALPNGMARQYVDAIDASHPDTVILDLSADCRFDPAWLYGLPELTRTHAAQHKRIANPGCYATAMQLAIAPMLDALDGPVQCFGVSGYCGDGTTPSDNNDTAKLRDNLMPNALIGHVHECEVAHRLGRAIEFMPHVAPHISGLTITANLHLSRPFALYDVKTRYREHYADEPLVRVLDDAPWASRIAGSNHAEVGVFTLSTDGRRLVVVATLDNLLKCAATQALQNLNCAFGFDEPAGIPLQGVTP